MSEPADPTETSASADAPGPVTLRAPDRPTGPRGSRGTSVPASLARSLRSTEREPGPGGLLLADIPDRAVALMIDLIVLALLAMVVAATIGAGMGGVVTAGSLDSSGGDVDVVPFVVVTGLVMALSLAYFASGWTRWRATLGMRLLGLAVIDEAGARPIGGRQAVVRWLVAGVPATVVIIPVYAPTALGWVLALLGLVALGVILVSIGRSPTRQGIHDRYAGTIVTTVTRRR